MLQQWSALVSAASVKCTQCGSLYQGFVLVTSLFDVDSRAAVSSHTCVCSDGFREHCAQLVKVLLQVKQLEER